MSGSESPVRMIVDDERCIGSGQCELLEDEVFRVDDDTAIAGVQEPGLLPRDRAEKVADRCPAGAISYEAPG